MATTVLFYPAYEVLFIPAVRHCDLSAAIAVPLLHCGLSAAVRIAASLLLAYLLWYFLGYHSVWARPAPDGPMGMYQEWVVYSKYQVRLLSVKVDGEELLAKRATRGGMLSASERGLPRL